MTEAIDVVRPAGLAEPGTTRLHPSELQRLAGLFAAAFEGDALIGWLAPRAEGSCAFFRALLSGVDRRWVQWTPCRSAAAVWIGSEQLGAGLTWQEVAGFPQIAVAAGPLGALHVLRFAATMAFRRPSDRPHEYLMLLGVDPQGRRKGLASELLKSRCLRLDELGRGAFLETSNPLNLDFYERHGFEVLESFRPLGGGPQLWSMWRAPRPPSYGTEAP